MSTQTEPQSFDEFAADAVAVLAASLKRAHFTDGLRQLAQFFDDHPEMPIPQFPDFSHCVSATEDAAGVAEVETIAATLSVEVSSGAHPSASREFAGLRYRAFYVPNGDMRAWNALTSYSGAVEPDDAQSERVA